MPSRTLSADPKPNRLILCFDGTGNAFQGTPGDTNIVKLYNMFARTNTSQMHYYQPGIGTYPAEGPVNVSWFRALMRKFEAVIDSALATSFDCHVIAGYRFIMRHFQPGDRIYIFGFSRGAFTARFLSRMISHVGLLSEGNDELVPFAYKVYQDFERNSSATEGQRTKEENFMNSFKGYFCRTELEAAPEGKPNYIKVHFLGLFDCVSSVGNLDVPFTRRTIPLPAVSGTAKHIRHAVAVDERRVKFRAALFGQEQKKEQDDDIKEVWFPGNHGDIGGGWDVCEHGGVHDRPDKDYFQLSDIALKWMINEIDHVESKYGDRANGLAWDSKVKDSFLERFKKHKKEMISARMHDTLTLNGGLSSTFKIMLWNLMEYIPWVIKRWELVKSPDDSKQYIWDYQGWPVNKCGRRDIPPGSLFHQSVQSRMQLPPDDGENHPEKYRRDLYVPDNELLVGTNDARKLSELAPHTTMPKSTKSRIHFVYADDVTIGSVAADGKSGVITDDWDKIYRVDVKFK